MQPEAARGATATASCARHVLLSGVALTKALEVGQHSYIVSFNPCAASAVAHPGRGLRGPQFLLWAATGAPCTTLRELPLAAVSTPPGKGSSRPRCEAKAFLRPTISFASSSVPSAQAAARFARTLQHVAPGAVAEPRSGAAGVKSAIRRYNEIVSLRAHEGVRVGRGARTASLHRHRCPAAGAACVRAKGPTAGTSKTPIPALLTLFSGAAGARGRMWPRQVRAWRASGRWLVRPSWRPWHSALSRPIPSRRLSDPAATRLRIRGSSPLLAAQPCRPSSSRELPTPCVQRSESTSSGPVPLARPSSVT